MMENKNNSILIAVAAALLIVVLGLGAYVAYDKGIIFNNKDNIKDENEKENNMQEDNKENNTIENVTEENNTQENNTQVNNTQKSVVNVVLVDPATEKFSECPTSIDNSKYLSKTPYGYYGNLSLTNVGAAIDEYLKCGYSSIAIKDNYIQYGANVGFGSSIFNLSNNGYGLIAKYYLVGSESDIISPRFYTFNNEYLVVTQGSTNTTGPAINDGVYIFDKNGKKVFESKDITLDILDKNGNLKNAGIKYTKICEGALFYEECEDITSGKIKYDTVNKKFIVKEETVKYTN